MWQQVFLFVQVEHRPLKRDHPKTTQVFPTLFSLRQLLLPVFVGETFLLPRSTASLRQYPAICGWMNHVASFIKGSVCVSSSFTWFFSRWAMWTHVPAPPVNLFFCESLPFAYQVLTCYHQTMIYLLVNWAANNWSWLFMVDFGDDTLLNYIWWLSLFNHPAQFCSYHQGLRASRQNREASVWNPQHTAGVIILPTQTMHEFSREILQNDPTFAVWKIQPKMVNSMTPQQNHERCKKTNFFLSNPKLSIKFADYDGDGFKICHNSFVQSSKDTLNANKTKRVCLQIIYISYQDIP